MDAARSVLRSLHARNRREPEWAGLSHVVDVAITALACSTMDLPSSTDSLYLELAAGTSGDVVAAAALAQVRHGSHVCDANVL